MNDQTKRGNSAYPGPDREPADEPGQDPHAAAPGGDRQPDQLVRERDELYDRLLRQAAEFDNYRKRIDRERQDLSAVLQADVLRDLLPLVDDLERALRAPVQPGAEAAFREGIELIHRQLQELLAKRGVVPIEALGADFDPHFHEAVTTETHPDRREGEVVDELVRGYTLGDRLLRPAMVKVATRG